MLMALSAFAANNQGAQDMASRLLGGTIALSTMLIMAFSVYRLCYRCHDGTKEKQKHCFYGFFFSLLGTPWLMILILFLHW